MVLNFFFQKAKEIIDSILNSSQLKDRIENSSLHLPLTPVLAAREFTFLPELAKAKQECSTLLFLIELAICRTSEIA